MSIGDMFDFEKFNLKDMWGKIKDDPERIFIGAIDPFSSELWSKIMGKEYDPLVNQLGGPQGSGWAGLGENGGVYQRAEEKGIDTSWSAGSHDVAEIIAAIYGGSALGELAGGGAGAAGGGGEAAASAGGAGGAGGASAGYVPAAADLAAVEAAGASAAGAGSAGGAGTGAWASGSWGSAGASGAGGGTDWFKMAGQLGGNLSSMGEQEEERLASEFARMGPPPNIAALQPAGPNSSGLGVVSDQYQKMLANIPRVPPRMTAGEAMTNNAYSTQGLGVV